MDERLKRDEDFTLLKSRLMDLYHSVMGGADLEGDGVCKLCPSMPPS
jgi:hypothetical protein